MAKVRPDTPRPRYRRGKSIIKLLDLALTSVTPANVQLAPGNPLEGYNRMQLKAPPSSLGRPKHYPDLLSMPAKVDRGAKQSELHRSPRFKDLTRLGGLPKAQPPKLKLLPNAAQIALEGKSTTIKSKEVAAAEKRLNRRMPTGVTNTIGFLTG